MQDNAIVELYWQRDEAAIWNTEERYGSYLLVVARRILEDEEDSRESVNDTYWKAWNSIPPQRPENLRTYLCRITRQTAVDRLRRRQAYKRVGTEYALSLEELAECVSGNEDLQDALERKELAQAVNDFLYTLESAQRQLFLQRYFYVTPLRDIATRQGCSISQVKSSLFRLRQRLRTYLEKEGFLI